MSKSIHSESQSFTIWRELDWPFDWRPNSGDWFALDNMVCPIESVGFTLDDPQEIEVHLQTLWEGSDEELISWCNLGRDEGWTVEEIETSRPPC